MFFLVKQLLFQLLALESQYTLKNAQKKVSKNLPFVYCCFEDLTMGSSGLSCYYHRACNTFNNYSTEMLFP
uniref:Putative secreted protein n=1 Tax=Anopheles triannulatus TaxID=58253 RepID=A0A2M4B315_9DIPT